MSEEELAFILRHSTPKEILIINHNNRLQVIKCPFVVMAKISVGELKKMECYKVERVLVDARIITVFEISNYLYYYHYFEIIT